MSNLLVIGGTHFIGREIARVAVDAGHDVTLFNRGRTDPDSYLPTIHGDVADLPRHRDELRELRPDAIIHCIAYTEQDAEHAVAVFEGLDAHLVVLGSQDCYAGFHQFRGDQETTDFPIAEDSPLAEPYYWRGTQHSNADTYDKNLMTATLLGAHEAGQVRATVLRLPMVYGPGDPQFEHRHGDIIWRVLDERPEFVIGHREQSVIWTYGYITNVAAAVLHAVAHESVMGKVFNVGETTVRTRRRWADLYANARQHTFQYRVVPDELLESDNPRDRPTYHIITDNSAFVRATGFAPPVSLEAGIAQTVQWAADHHDEIGSPPDYDRQIAAADLYHEFIEVTTGETVNFVPVESIAESVAAEFERHRKFLAELLPDAEIEHVGSTAIPGSLTKGDLDIQVRVTADQFDEAVEVLSSHFDWNEGNPLTNTFASFKDDDQPAPLGVQATVIGSDVDCFCACRDALLRDAELVEEYNELKRSFDGKAMDAYREAKAAFFEQLKHRLAAGVTA